MSICAPIILASIFRYVFKIFHNKKSETIMKGNEKFTWITLFVAEKETDPQKEAETEAPETPGPHSCYSQHGSSPPKYVRQ